MQTPWKTDEELFAAARKELFTAVVGDVMDIMGYRNQFLPPAIQPLRDDMVVIGRAMPVLEADDTGGEGPGRANDLMNRPFGLMLRALDDLKTNEVYICSGSSPNYALWGELMSMAATNRGAAGAVVNGYSRDTRGILVQNFPTFSYGRYAQDQRPRGKVIDFRCTLQVGAVSVSRGAARDRTRGLRGSLGKGQRRTTRLRGHQRRHGGPGSMGHIRNPVSHGITLRRTVV
jgi:regulator of RNase E activity RraA